MDEIKFLPYESTHRHRYWFIDFQYLFRIGEDQHSYHVGHAF
jgi:hypothetical protein